VPGLGPLSRLQREPGHPAPGLAGVHCVTALLTGLPIEGTWCDCTREWEARWFTPPAKRFEPRSESPPAPRFFPSRTPQALSSARFPLQIRGRAPPPTLYDGESVSRPLFRRPEITLRSGVFSKSVAPIDVSPLSSLCDRPSAGSFLEEGHLLLSPAPSRARPGQPHPLFRLDDLLCFQPLPLLTPNQGQRLACDQKGGTCC
jgi:hypothetical protein